MWPERRFPLRFQYENNKNCIERYEALHQILDQNRLLKLNKGAEVGVRQARTAEFLLSHNPKLQLILVDPYLPYQDVVNFYDEAQQLAWKNEAKERVLPFEPRVTWIYETSSRASLAISNHSLDFVFIDAEHTEAAALTDCILWHPKVRKGGILAGHDYAMKEVKAGVDKFVAKEKLKLHYIPYDADIWVIEI